MSRFLLRSALLGLATLVLGGEPAGAKPLATSGNGAVVTSVDGAAELTVKIGRRTLPARLWLIDTPRAGECGAAQAKAALAGFVRRAPRRLTYNLVVDQKLVAQRDPDGRYLIALGYPVRRTMRSLGNDLVRAAWARFGGSTTLDAAAPTARVGLAVRGAGDDVEGYEEDGTSLFGPTGPRRGMWATCGGRLHLPAGEPVPATSAATWEVNRFGVTERIGALALPATQTPESSLTIRRLSELVPVELTGGSFGPCVAWVPSLQVQAWTFDEGAPSASCGEATVHLILTSGPDPASLSLGGGVGQPRVATTRAYPQSLIDAGKSDFDFLWLPGPGHEWSWQTGVSLGKGRGTDLLTYASPGPLDN